MSLVGIRRRWLGGKAQIAVLSALIVLIATVLASSRIFLKPDDAHLLRAVRNTPGLSGPPEVLPQQLRPVSPQDARAINARKPFADDELMTARPFNYVGTEEARTRAIDCLAAAAWYEAGDDASGEKAVIQTVLNRVRHLTFPATVCGVVFQGSDRQTGCQFTFTCDGSLARIPPEASWRRARALAEQALKGAVDPRVGQATHYHADYVVPYWSSSLDKIAKVGPHIFYRWHGFWGDPGAFRRKATTGIEPLAQKLANISSAHRLAGNADLEVTGIESEPELGEAAPLPPAIQLTGVREKSLRGAQVRGQSGSQFFIQLQPDIFPGNYATAALAICAGRPLCTVLGWREPRHMSFSVPLSSSSDRSLTFYFHRDEKAGERALWNCDQIQRANKAQCLPVESAGLSGLNR